MKKTTQLLFVITCFLLMAMPSQAVPVKSGIWKAITLTDGTKVLAELRGDEFFHFFMDKEHQCYVETRPDVFRRIGMEECMKEAQIQMEAEKALEAGNGQAGKRRSARLQRDDAPTDYFTGSKHAIVILMEFDDVKFDSGVLEMFNYTSTLDLFKDIINKRNFNMPPFLGSVKDYFIDQSDGQLEIDFDVVGPFKADYDREYYGKNSDKGKDTMTKKILIREAVYAAINAGVDFSKYDWDGDDEVEEVYVLYAGQGENDGGPKECIWPHMSTNIGVSDGIHQEIGGKTITIKNYACSNELSTNIYYDDEGASHNDRTQLNGIGTICHEFSHCLGYLDTYDIEYLYKGNEMGRWDLMCSGSYNGAWNGGHEDWDERRSGYCPPGYTSFERWWAGWIEPIVLDDPQKVTNLKPLGGTANGGPEDHGEAYVMYVPDQAENNIFGQYYLLENRQNANWDFALPWYGLLITYVHYDQDLWDGDLLNTISEGVNTHQRMTNFQACGKDWLHRGYTHLHMDTYPYDVDLLPSIIPDTNEYWDEDGSTLIDQLNDFYPDYAQYYHYNNTSNNSLDDTTTPAAYYWTVEEGVEVQKPLVGQEIWNIENNNDEDHTVSFAYKKNTAILSLDEDTTEPEGLISGLYAEVITNRVLQNDKYNTLWLPFDMNQNDIKNFLGEDARVYQFTGVTTTGEGENIKTVLNFEDITQNGLPAYTPVIVTLSSNNDGNAIGFENPVQVELTEAEVVTSADGWQFIGTLQSQTIPQGDFYLKDNKYYESQGGTKIKAYRAYFKAPEGISHNANSFSCDFADAPDDTNADKGWNKHQFIDSTDSDYPYMYMDDLTGIHHRETAISLPENDGMVYNLNGQKVCAVNQLHSLLKGIYVIGGRKYIVK